MGKDLKISLVSNILTAISPIDNKVNKYRYLKELYDNRFYLISNLIEYLFTNLNLDLEQLKSNHLTVNLELDKVYPIIKQYQIPLIDSYDEDNNPIKRPDYNISDVIDWIKSHYELYGITAYQFLNINIY